jgi:hypothetical protein
VVIRCVCAADGCSETFEPKRRGRPRLYCARCSTKTAYNRRWRAGVTNPLPPKPYVRLLPREAECERCGERYTQTTAGQLYCGKGSCGEFVTVACDHCGEEFEARARDRERGWAKFCGKPCALRTRRAAEREATAA